MAAVETIARLAVVQRVDAVLVAGDVFDAQTEADRTIRKLFNALQGFPEPWIVIPGNHVSALTESVWTRAARQDAVPANLHRALQGMVLDFPALGFSALTAPLTQRHIYTDLTEWFDEASTAPGHVRSGVPHGGVQGVLAGDVEPANPNRAERAACAKLGRPTQIFLGDARVQSDDQRLEKVKRAHLRCGPTPPGAAVHLSHGRQTQHGRRAISLLASEPTCGMQRMPVHSFNEQVLNSASEYPARRWRSGVTIQPA